MAADLRWVSGEVFGTNRCVTSTRRRVTAGRAITTLPLNAHLCGPAGGAAMIEQPPLGPVTRPR